jgi:type 1 glutamine amidotransferase
MLKHLVVAALVAAAVLAPSNVLADTIPATGKIRVVIIDGQNNHDWRATTPFMKKALESSGRFVVDVATGPTHPGNPPGMPGRGPKKPADPIPGYAKALERYMDAARAYSANMDRFRPNLAKYDVVLSNYNGEYWNDSFATDLDAAVRSGKIGLVIVHAANNSFGGGWNEFNRMIGMGWYSPSVGPRVYLNDDGKEVMIPKGKGDGPGHRYTGPFSVVIRDPDHPITKGMPREWMHARDELYDNMRGPIESIHLLATAYSKGTKVNEPMIWTISYGKGRIFHTPMGHDVGAMHCVGFITTLQRGSEWAATGTVTIPVPANFPSATKTSTVETK